MSQICGFSKAVDFVYKELETSIAFYHEMMVRTAFHHVHHVIIL